MCIQFIFFKGFKKFSYHGVTYSPTVRLHHGVFMYKDDVVGGITSSYSMVLYPTCRSLMHISLVRISIINAGQLQVLNSLPYREEKSLRHVAAVPTDFWTSTIKPWACKCGRKNEKIDLYMLYGLLRSESSQS